MSRYVPKVKYELPNQHGKCCTLLVPEQMKCFLEDLPKEKRVIKQKAFPTSVECKICHKSVKGVADERSEWSIITTSTTDFEGESLDPKGAIWSRFVNLPSVFIGHNYDGDGFLKCRQWKPVVNGFKAETIYPFAPSTWNQNVLWEPDKYWAYVDAGTMIGKSIGYVELESGLPSQQEIDAQPDLEKCLNRIRSWLVLEYSLTNIPVNGDCFVVQSGEPAKSVSIHDVMKKSVAPEMKFKALLKKCLHK